MAVLVGAASRVVIQGITGSTGRVMAERMLADGTCLVAGVTPGKGGQLVGQVPVFESCYAALAETGANASFISVPPPFALEAVLEAIDAGLRLMVVYTEHVPLHDAVVMVAQARAHGATLLGPNSAGCVAPGLTNLSDLNGAYLDAGRIGIVSKSGTLTYEVAAGLRRAGLGESTIVCLGGDEIVGTDHADVLGLFGADPETDGVILIGEVGGRSELLAAEHVARMCKPVVAYVAGRAAPAGKRMGHAGAIIGGDEEGAAAKMTALQRAGATVAATITEVAPSMVALLGSRAGDMFTEGRRSSGHVS